MRISKRRLRQIIKEEQKTILKEWPGERFDVVGLLSSGIRTLVEGEDQIVEAFEALDQGDNPELLNALEEQLDKLRGVIETIAEIKKQAR